MAAQDERESGVVVMCSSVLGPMAQDIPEQDIVMGEQEQFFPPQMDPEPEMCAAAAEAAVYDTSPPLLHQNPPLIPAETVHPSVPDMAQLCAMLAGVTAAMHQMQGEIKNSMEKKMDGMAQTVREEMQCMGAGLQNGLEEVKGGLEQLKKGNGELRRATRWATEERRLVEVTEEVTVTETYRGR